MLKNNNPNSLHDPIQSKFNDKFLLTDEIWAMTLVCTDAPSSINRGSARSRPQSFYEHLKRGALDKAAGSLVKSMLNRGWSTASEIIGIPHHDDQRTDHGHIILFIEGLETNVQRKDAFGPTWVWAADFVLNNPHQDLAGAFISSRAGKVRTARSLYEKMHELKEDHKNNIYFTYYDNNHFHPMESQYLRLNFKDEEKYHSSVTFYLAASEGKKIQQEIMRQQIQGAPNLQIIGHNCSAWALDKLSQCIKVPFLNIISNSEPLINLVTKNQVIIPKKLQGKIKENLEIILAIAICKGDILTVESCINLKADVFRCFDVDKIANLLNKNAQLSLEDIIGHNPLTLAVEKGRHAIIQLLLNQGVSAKQYKFNHCSQCKKPQVTYLNGDNESPLIIAARNGDFKVIEMLLNAEGDPYYTTSLRGKNVFSYIPENSAQGEKIKELFRVNNEYRRRLARIFGPLARYDLDKIGNKSEIDDLCCLLKLFGPDTKNPSLVSQIIQVLSEHTEDISPDDKTMNAQVVQTIKNLQKMTDENDINQIMKALDPLVVANSHYVQFIKNYIFMETPPLQAIIKSKHKLLLEKHGIFNNQKSNSTDLESIAERKNKSMECKKISRSKSSA